MDFGVIPEFKCSLFSDMCCWTSYFLSSSFQFLPLRIAVRMNKNIDEMSAIIPVLSGNPRDRCIHSFMH
jgi:hypothetical protein